MRKIFRYIVHWNYRLHTVKLPWMHMNMKVVWNIRLFNHKTSKVHRISKKKLSTSVSYYLYSVKPKTWAVSWKVEGLVEVWGLQAVTASLMCQKIPTKIASMLHISFRNLSSVIWVIVYWLYNNQDMYVCIKLHRVRGVSISSIFSKLKTIAICQQ